MPNGRKCFTWSGDTVAWYSRVLSFVNENVERVLAILAFVGIGTIATLIDRLKFLSFINEWVWNKGKLVLIAGALLASGSFILAWWIHSDRRAKLEAALHAFAHKTRDDILKHFESADPDVKDIKLAFTHMLSRITTTFKVAVRNHDLEAVLWIADNSGGGQYVAFAETSGVDENLCRPIARDGQLVKVLRETCHLRGVIHIPDASKIRNDEELRELSTHVGTRGCAAIIPINIWERDKKCLGGLLSVMSKKSFHLRHVELLMACADILGLAYKSLELTSRATRTTNAPKETSS